jgi:hypothetical protein
MKKPSKPTTTGGSTGGGFSEILGNPMNSLGQETSEIPDPLIYGYQRGGQVPMTPGNMFRRRMAIMRGGVLARPPMAAPQMGPLGYQRGGQVDGGGPPAWAGRPTQPTAGIPAGTLPPGLQGTLPPGLANMPALPQGLSNYSQNRGQPDQSNTAAAQGYARGGKIQPLNPANKGKFTASAKGAGKSVQGFASEVLNAPKGRFSPQQRRRANFAKNAAKWNH